jgi:3-oxoadipate enol-lactonase
MPSVTLGKLSLHYLDAGAGPAVLLLHAFPLHKEMWTPQLGALASRYRVIAPDARGMGLSRPFPEALTMELYADDAAAVLDHVGIDKVIVGGLSMGGYAALAFWKRHRARVGGLILADTRATADTEEAKAARESFAVTALNNGIEWVIGEMITKLQRPQPLPAVDTELRRLIGDNLAMGAAAAQRGMARRADFTAELGKIAVPTLVIVGEDDALTPPAHAEALARAIPGAKLVKIPKAGHIANLEDPAAFNIALLDFLAAAKPERMPP